MKSCVKSLTSLWLLQLINCAAIHVPPVWQNPSSTWQPSLQLKKEKKIVLVVPSFKNAQWYRYNLDSILAQEYENYHVVYLDDCSPDNTAQLVKEYVIEHKQEHRFTIIANDKRVGALANIYRAVHEFCKDSDIVAQLDGDDWLASNNVFTMLNEAYEDPSVWMTYGQYMWHPCDERGACKPIPRDVIAQNSYRTYGAWVTSQLRTFYAGLFKHVKKEDLLFDGKFYPMAWDVAYMIPMLEMAHGRIKFIPHITYIYNCVTSLNDHKVCRQLQVALDNHVRKRKSYERLETLPYAIYSTPVKDHEAWWSRVVGKDRSVDWFAMCLGDKDAPSRIKVRNHIMKMNYTSILDIPSGLCVDHAHTKHIQGLRYFGVDISSMFIQHAHQQGIDAMVGSIEHIPFSDSSFDMCNVRHIIEHLDYYEKAVDELIRVARQEVLIIFFIKPHDADDIIDCNQVNGNPIYHNTYNIKKLEQYVANNPKVDTFAWDEVNSIETILHIYLKD